MSCLVFYVNCFFFKRKTAYDLLISDWCSDVCSSDLAVFDAVLMDLQMPEVDGLTAARAIMSDAAFRDLPIVAITANAFEDDRRRSLEAGMAAHVSKPVDPLQLYAVLMEHLGSRRR